MFKVLLTEELARGFFACCFVLFCAFVRELTSDPRTLNFHFIVSNILIVKERKTHKNEKKISWELWECGSLFSTLTDMFHF